MYIVRKHNNFFLDTISFYLYVYKLCLSTCFLFHSLNVTFLVYNRSDSRVDFFKADLIIHMKISRLLAPANAGSSLADFIPFSSFFSWIWRRYVPPKRRLTQYLHGATSQGTSFFIITADKTTNHTFIYLHNYMCLLPHKYGWNYQLFNNSTQSSSITTNTRSQASSIHLSSSQSISQWRGYRQNSSIFQSVSVLPTRILCALLVTPAPIILTLIHHLKQNYTTFPLNSAVPCPLTSLQEIRPSFCAEP
jgi:hypothetical protein